MKIIQSPNVIIFFVFLFLHATMGCSGLPNRSYKLYGKKNVDVYEENITPDENNLRMIASLKLTDQGKQLLAEGRYEDAISIFERSININSENGKNYYFLAEAWLKKGNAALAEEFNRLAALYVKHGSELSKQVNNQKYEIKKNKTEQE